MSSAGEQSKMVGTGEIYEVHKTLNAMLESPIWGLVDVGPRRRALASFFFREWQRDIYSVCHPASAIETQTH